MNPALQLTVTALASALALTGCTSVETPAPSRSAQLTWITCPVDVEVQFVSRHECAELTVPQDHNDPAGATLKLLVLKVWPVGVEPKPGFVASLGANPGDPGALGGDIAAGATRGGWISINLTPRGTVGHAGPSLACPEVEQVSTAHTSDRDPATRAAFVSAVSACASRLRADGVEPAAFNAAAAVEDLEALRISLGEDAWAASGTYGTASRAALIYLARHPGRIDRVVLDSPASADLDPLTAGVVGLDSALAELAKSQPGLLTSWRKALAVTGRAPLAGGSKGAKVVVDDAKLVRLIRAALGGDGPENVKAVPAIIAAAARGRLHPSLAALATAESPYCLGYVPLCRDRSNFALGLFLTDLCEHLPTDRTALDTAIAGRPSYRQAFGNSPYEEACAAWNVPPAATIAVSANGTPTLLMSGGLDSFSRPEWSERLAHLLGPTAWSVAIPGHTHNVLGSSQCAISVRDRWRRNPPAAPETTCLK